MPFTELMEPTRHETSIQVVPAVLQARTLLLRLSDHQLTPRISRDLRAEARTLLRWFPRTERLRPVQEGAAHLQRQGKSFIQNQNPLIPGDLSD
jgi:hypothetical protein